MQRKGCAAAGCLELQAAVSDASATLSAVLPGLQRLSRTALCGLVRAPCSPPSLPSLPQHPQPTEIGQSGATWQRETRIKR